MNKIVKKEYLTNNNIKLVSIDEIINNLANISISDIALDEKNVISSPNGTVIFEKTDYENPIVLKTYNFTSSIELLINIDWYVDHVDEINNLIKQIIINSTRKELSLSNTCFINSEIIDSLCKNKFLEVINLDNYSKNGYILTSDDYLKLKKSTIKKVNSKGVSEELRENFDPIIGFNQRSLVSHYKYDDLANDMEENIYLSENLSEDELVNLKYLSSKKVLKLQKENIINFNLISDRLKSLGKNNKIVLDVKNKTEFNNFIFNQDISYDNLFVCVNNFDVPIKKYFILEKLLYSIIEPAKNLSPFEKYIYAYNIAKRYKKYNENIDDKDEARNLYSLLENEYMVCVGFSSLFGDLLDKLGIPNQELGITVDISYDDIKNIDDIKPEEKIVEYAGHSRRRVHITDEKYGIDGIYISDPTWDNDIDDDYYNHLVMTDEESTKARRFVKMNLYYIEELFDVHSIEEFYNKINFLLDKGKSLKWAGYKDLKYIVKDIVEEIRTLDNDVFNKIRSKYDFIDKGTYSYPDDLNDLLYELGNYIVNNVNKEISGETIMSAVEAVYRYTNIYPEDKIEAELERTKEVNRERQVKCFPPRHKYYADGCVEEDSTWYNKFDIHSSEKVI